jgi:hypothetical protein
MVFIQDHEKVLKSKLPGYSNHINNPSKELFYNENFTELQKGLFYFVNEQCQKAADVLTSINEPMISYYKAFSLLKLIEYDEALLLFRKTNFKDGSIRKDLCRLISTILERNNNKYILMILKEYFNIRKIKRLFY